MGGDYDDFGQNKNKTKKKKKRHYEVKKNEANDGDVETMYTADPSK
jgi:hypothetical protein